MSDKVAINYNELGKILKSSEMEQLLRSLATRYESGNTRTNTFIGHDRAHCVVRPRHRGKRK